jgi:hypothetical protein
MPKTVALTVKVDDTEFKQFVARFNAFSAQIGQLNTQFKAINTTIKKAQTDTKAWVDILKSSWTVITSIGGAVTKVSRGFMRWGVTIGGIVSMLTTGAGLFGIDRLAASIMQRRRLAMGLGADYGRTQGALIAGQSIVDDPKALLQSISRGIRGAPAEQMGLAALGVRPGGETDPTKAMSTVLMNLWERIHDRPERAKIPIGRALRGGLQISDEDITRIGGMKTREEIQKFIREREEFAAKTRMTPEAQDAWSDLAKVFAAAKVAIESAFGEGLAKLTGPMTQVSNALVDLIKALFKTGTVTKILDLLTKLLTRVASHITSKDFQKSLDHWDEEIKKWVPTLREVKEALELFKDMLLGIANFLRNVGILSPTFEQPPERKEGQPPAPEQPGGPRTWRLPTPGAPPGGDKPKGWFQDFFDKMLGGKGNLPFGKFLQSSPQQQQAPQQQAPQQQPPSQQQQQQQPPPQQQQQAPQQQPPPQQQGSFSFGGPTQLASFIQPPVNLFGGGQQPALPAQSPTVTSFLGGGQFAPSIQNVALQGMMASISPQTTLTTPEAPVTPETTPTTPKAPATPEVPKTPVISSSNQLFAPGTFLSQRFASAQFMGGAVAAPGTPATSPVSPAAAPAAPIGGVMGGGLRLGGGINIRTQALMTRNQFGFGGTNLGGSRNITTGLAFGGSRGGDINIGDRTGGDINMRGGERSRMFASIRGGNRIAMFGGAARGRVPGNEMNAFGLRGGNVGMVFADNRRSSRVTGPLDADNWQMNRTTNLTIRNVPGSNVYAQANAMSG